MTNTEVTPATRDAAERTATKAAADAQMAGLITAHQNSPEMKLQRDRDELARLTSDPHTLDRSQREIEALQGRIAQAEAGADAAVAAQVLSDEQRVDLVLAGKTDFRGPSATIDGQIPPADFADAIQSDLAAGVPAPLVKAFYGSGKSDDRLGHVAARMWLDRFDSDPEMQRMFAIGDSTVVRKFRQAALYLAGRHPGVTAEEEAAHRARLTEYWGW